MPGSLLGNVLKAGKKKGSKPASYQLFTHEPGKLNRVIYAIFCTANVDKYSWKEVITKKLFISFYPHSSLASDHFLLSLKLLF